MINWGVPDWREASGYPRPKAITHRQWRWQFLRRRPDYREAWTRWARPIDGDVATTNDPDSCRENFCLSALLNPRADFSDLRLFQAFWPLSGYGYTWKLERFGERDEEHHRTGYMFDLKEPIRPQIVKAEAYLVDLQTELHSRKVQRRTRRDKWPLYLRALDAKDAGASYAEMAHAFFANQAKTSQKARDTVGAAQALRDNFPA